MPLSRRTTGVAGEASTGRQNVPTGQRNVPRGRRGRRNVSAVRPGTYGSAGSRQWERSHTGSGVTPCQRPCIKVISEALRRVRVGSALTRPTSTPRSPSRTHRTHSFSHTAWKWRVRTLPLRFTARQSEARERSHSASRRRHGRRSSMERRHHGLSGTHKAPDRASAEVACLPRLRVGGLLRPWASRTSCAATWTSADPAVRRAVPPARESLRRDTPASAGTVRVRPGTPPPSAAPPGTPLRRTEPPPPAAAHPRNRKAIPCACQPSRTRPARSSRPPLPAVPPKHVVPAGASPSPV